MSAKAFLLASFVAPTIAFQQPLSPSTSSTSRKAATLTNERQIYDPFNLYPESSQERVDGRIRSLEPEVKAIKPIIDPMGLYPSSSGTDEAVDMSEALPFVPRPALLNRELAGDAGFDPLNLADTAEKLSFMRESELKHSRIAMLASIGWLASEALNRPIANLIHMKPLLLENGNRVPSLLNGGLGSVTPFYWMLVLGIVGGFEIAHQMNPGTGFDPLNVFPHDAADRKWWETAEIKNGRLAMMAFVGFAAQECFSGISVLDSLPFVSSSVVAEAAVSSSEMVAIVHGFSG